MKVIITGLQAWFMHADAAETSAKTARQEDPRTADVLKNRDQVSTPLGKILWKQRGQLYLPPNEQFREPETPVAVAPTPSSASATAPQSKPEPKLWVSIDSAMDLVSRDYAQRKTP